MVRGVFAAVVTRQHRRPIADDPLRSGARHRIYPPRNSIRFGPDDEESTRPVKHEESLIVEMGLVHHTNRRRLGQQQVAHVDIVQLALGYVDKAWDAAPQTEQRMHLHRRFRPTTRHPWKQRQAKVDGSTVQHEHRIGKVQTQIFFGIELPEFLQSAVVHTRRRSASYGARWRRSGWNAGRERGCPCDTTWPNKPRALLRYRADSRGRPAEQRPVRERIRCAAGVNPMVAAVAVDNAREGRPRRKFHQLRKQRLASMHGMASGMRVLERSLENTGAFKSAPLIFSKQRSYSCSCMNMRLS